MWEPAVGGARGLATTLRHTVAEITSMLEASQSDNLNGYRYNTKQGPSAPADLEGPR